MPDQSITTLSAGQLAHAVRSGSLTCEGIAAAFLARVEAREADVGAWAYIDAEHVMSQARHLDRNPAHGPLVGVPVGFKDIIDTSDLPTEYGSPIYRGYRPGRDAACVALSRRAQAIVMGKTVTTEFANFHPGKTRNPLDLSRTPGGSSSGSAAAVADGMVPLAIGTQTTASVIRPASFCGVFGYRPTYGLVRCSGVMESSGSLDTLGLFARSIEDIDLFRSVLMSEDLTVLPQPPEKLKIGFCRTNIWPRVDPHVRASFERAALQLQQSGAIVEDVTLPSAFDELEPIHKAISSYEFYRNFTTEIDNHWESISPTLRQGRIKAGQACTTSAYVEANRVAFVCRAELDAVFDKWEVLLTPATLGEPPVGSETTGDPSACIIWTTMHVPAMTIPVFKGPNNLPVGAQIIGARHRDRQMLAAAAWIQKVLIS